ncbi:hypothetical protein MUK42_34075 [Musa troglodytarum]|uniref:Uncharacterized protein n=1 Tax=Musa troglodytarum TaxID=320322 RepID=A0A9E7E891_9LILI|nr:hypothetical protein MUK42_34075 [Musa troglodytarum]
MKVKAMSTTCGDEERLALLQPGEEDEGKGAELGHFSSISCSKMDACGGLGRDLALPMMDCRSAQGGHAVGMRLRENFR